MVDNKKGIIHSTSFSNENQEQWLYVNKIASERFGGNVSMAIMDTIKCHQQATELYGEWRQMQQPPPWYKVETKEES